MHRAMREPLSAERAADWLRMLAEDIGPRRPTSRAERTAAEWLRGELARRGVKAELEAFPAYASFAVAQAPPLVAALAAAALHKRAPRLSGCLGLLALAAAGGEDDLRLRIVSRAVARRRSQNLVATIEPRDDPARTVCLVSHMDSSRSGILFDRRVAPHARALLALTSAALGVEALSPVLERRRLGRAISAGARGWLVSALGLLAERELRGEDVPGANDNASGAALTASLAAELASEPLERTRVVLVITGAEEAGTLGIDALLRSRDTSGWMFLNFDGVAAPATLRYLPREGMLRTFAADERLLALAGRVAAEHPELGFERAQRLVGLTYDATPVLARGGRALTISAQDDSIPNYHQPSDSVINADREVLRRALEVGRALIAAIDRGEAD